MTQPRIEVVLNEWQRSTSIPLSPQLLELLGPGAHGVGIASQLGEKLRLSPGFGGLEIESTSYVGRVQVGPLRISIHPKIATTTLTRMLRYVYGFTDLWRPDWSTSISADLHGLQDLLVELLLMEVEKLLRAGLPRTYQSRTDRLDAIRGRIEAQALARRGVLTEPRIDCTFFERTSNWHLNRVLLAGLRLARRVCQQPSLARRSERLLRTMEDTVSRLQLTHEDVSGARNALTRLTSNAAPALELIELLLEGSGLALTGPRELEASAFLFDMNRFFQLFLSKFLREHSGSLRVTDEHTIRDLYSYSASGGPAVKGRPPSPRPDFALFDESGALRMYLDAKYRDLSKRSLPPHWLYQLSVYALASPNQTSILLYPTISETTQQTPVMIRDPASGKLLGNVMLRPVAIDILGRLVGSSRSSDRAQCAEIAAQLLSG